MGEHLRAIGRGLVARAREFWAKVKGTLLMSEEKQRAQAARAEAARRILEDPLVKDFFAKCKSTVRAEWENTVAGEGAAREHHWHLHQAIGLLEECFTQTIRSGEFAAKQLQQKAEKEKT